MAVSLPIPMRTGTSMPMRRNIYSQILISSSSSSSNNNNNGKVKKMVQV